MSVMASSTVSTVPARTASRSWPSVSADCSRTPVSVAMARNGIGAGPLAASGYVTSEHMATADTKALIEEAIRGFQREVPALQRLKLVMELELRGRGDIQLFRVEVPGPKITKDIASDAKVRLSVPRSHFNELAREGTIRHWREAFESGTVRATGPTEILKLIA